MSKFEKRLCIFALVFVALYLGAVVLTIHSRIDKADKIERIESMALTPEKSQLMLVELLLPMLILLTLTVCFIIVRKTRAKKALLLDDSNEEIS
jgi:hypothetical protein